MEQSNQSHRNRWTHSDRRRKQPSLYDEYLNQEKLSQSAVPSPAQPSNHTRPGPSLTRDASSTTIRTVTPETSNNNSISNTNTNNCSDSNSILLASHRACCPQSNTNTNADVNAAAATATATSAAAEQTDESLSINTSIQAFETQFLPLFAPPPSPGNSTFAHKERVSPRTIARGVLGRSESTDATKRDNFGRIVGSRRPRTKTLDENKIRDKSPATRHRLRHGSVHTTTPSHSASDSISSLSHPQLASPLSQTSFSSTSTAPPPRPLSPVSTIASVADSMSGPLPSANAKRILHLMKTLCGRMSGNLHFRRSPAAPWQFSYCYIQEDAGSLMCEPEQDAVHHRTLVPDLRGCQVRTAMDDDSQTPYLEVSLPNTVLDLHIRLKDRSDFDSWFAALLCWNPIRPKGIHNRMTKPQSPITGTPLSTESSRRNSDMSMTLKEAPVIKVGPMIYWDSNISYSNATAPRGFGRPQAARMQSYGSHWWRRVSCTLRENGEMKLFADSGTNLLSVVQLSQLSRCAIQRLDPSVLDNDYCIAIYPQYTAGATVAPSIRPIYLSLETRILYEVWFVLLRAFTLPQLYGAKPVIPEENNEGASPQAIDNMVVESKDTFRMERSLMIRIVEARLPNPGMSVRAEFNHQHAVRHGQWPPSPQQQDAHYVEILLDGESRGKTQIKHEALSPFWREEFEYLDLPAVLTSASVLLRRRPPDLTTPREQHEIRLVHEAYGLTSTGQRPGQSAGFTGISHDQTLGKVEIFLEDLEGTRDVEKWWPVVNAHGEGVGEILIKARAEENVILMSKDYEPLSQLLHNFENELTLQIAQMIPTELRRLSDILLNIFQVSGKVGDWICSLVEEEIDGVHKETPASRLRYSRRIGNDAENAAMITASSQRELMVRDMNKNATLEANLLFRGNTLLTKSLDTYMRRVGREYLLAALGPTIRDINEKDPDCEVDPNRVANERALERNWAKLLQFTQEVWNAIRKSVNDAPMELKIIFRHIRACAEDRYGDFLRSVSYSSVSGFLFLRFFCPAVLNPKLFGLLKDDPKTRSRRTFTLIAKSLQGLANMASFGSKEHWMEPMNTFLGSHREHFKSFIDDICTMPVTSEPVKPPVQPTAYLTPIAIRNRLPRSSREGFPSLPYLIDQAREFAGLIELWLHGTSGKDGNEGLATAIGKEDGDLLSFHVLCTELSARTQECLSRAEKAERPNSSLSFRWEELIDQLQHSSILDPSSRPRSKDGDADTEGDNGYGNSGYDLETPTRDSFDDVALRAAGEAAARARGQFSPITHPSSDLDDAIEEEDIGSEQVFENDRDGGAASITASMLQQEQSTVSLDRRAGMHFRSSFDMARANAALPSTSASSMTSGSGSLQTSISMTAALPPPREPTINSLRDRSERDREISRDIEASLAQTRRNIGNPPLSAQFPPREGSAYDSPGSGLSSSETDSNATTALPSLQKEKERREREKERQRKKEREERDRRLKDFMPLANIVGGLKGRRKDRKAASASGDSPVGGGSGGGGGNGGSAGD
ncbi:hypothetical protein AAFC00_000841 [Neodothiora populina]|uniref:Ras-GAP domain-containing protein n=1 Tax=Neodothiora populina TaxID=2781224 RepID=A0ABR3PLW5_9PEZI